ncbi:MAG: hypothetical protein RSF73_09895 [Ruthenibacterium sp.]
MTFAEIEQSTKIFLIPSEISDVVESDPDSIRRQAQDNPSKLGFPVTVVGCRVKIPRAGFVFFMKYGRPAP